MIGKLSSRLAKYLLLSCYALLTLERCDFIVMATSGITTGVAVHQEYSMNETFPPIPTLPPLPSIPNGEEYVSISKRDGSVEKVPPSLSFPDTPITCVSRDDSEIDQVLPPPPPITTKINDRVSLIPSLEIIPKVNENDPESKVGPSSSSLPPPPPVPPLEKLPKFNHNDSESKFKPPLSYTENQYQQHSTKNIGNIWQETSTSISPKNTIEYTSSYRQNLYQKRQIPPYDQNIPNIQSNQVQYDSYTSHQKAYYSSKRSNSLFDKIQKSIYRDLKDIQKVTSEDYVRLKKKMSLLTERIPAVMSTITRRRQNTSLSRQQLTRKDMFGTPSMINKQRDVKLPVVENPNVHSSSSIMKQRNTIKPEEPNLYKEDLKYHPEETKTYKDEFDNTNKNFQNSVQDDEIRKIFFPPLQEDYLPKTYFDDDVNSDETIWKRIFSIPSSFHRKFSQKHVATSESDWIEDGIQRKKVLLKQRRIHKSLSLNSSNSMIPVRIKELELNYKSFMLKKRSSIFLSKKQERLFKLIGHRKGFFDMMTTFFFYLFILNLRTFLTNDRNPFVFNGFKSADVIQSIFENEIIVWTLFCFVVFFLSLATNLVFNNKYSSQNNSTETLLVIKTWMQLFRKNISNTVDDILVQGDKYSHFESSMVIWKSRLWSFYFWSISVFGIYFLLLSRILTIDKVISFFSSKTSRIWQIEWNSIEKYVELFSENLKRFITNEIYKNSNINSFLASSLLVWIILNRMPNFENQKFQKRVKKAVKVKPTTSCVEQKEIIWTLIALRSGN